MHKEEGRFREGFELATSRMREALFFLVELELTVPSKLEEAWA